MKIYKIIADSPDGKFYCYIGSTSKELYERLRGHISNYSNYLKNKFKYITSFKIIQKSWFEINLIEDLGNCSKNELLNREDYYINYYRNLVDDYIVVNKNKPNNLDLEKIKIRKRIYTTKIEFKNSQDKYRQSEKFKEYNRQYQKNYYHTKIKRK